MALKIATTLVLILALGQDINASFFGLFGSSNPTRKPDAVVSESPKSETDNIAYQNYLRSLASSTYYVPTNTPPPPPVQYVPVYTYQLYPHQKSIYHARITPKTVPIQYHYQPVKARVDLPNTKLVRPITVLPSSSYDESSISSFGRNNNLNKFIESSPAASQNDVLTRVKTHEFEIPEPQLSATLYDLPITGISPDYRTGGYVTKMMTASSSNSDNTSSNQKFGHAYENGDGTKVSEEGQLIQYGNGQETVVKRGQYEYIDANGKPVSVKWVADDNGFRLVN
ncbi:uncharacterized protein LOC129951588 [Eupeodes corollae]|uniref:uncharacterized protein LOC129951588 n=1 Tax=Eupeodes corollae TaxID=290404 RepID=UPI002490E136|nr:uncharacterized protein LOC129951588 [Eupeodes corollae]